VQSTADLAGTKFACDMRLLTLLARTRIQPRAVSLNQLSNLFTVANLPIIKPVNKNKSSFYTSHRRSTTVSLETFPSMTKKTLYKRKNSVCFMRLPDTKFFRRKKVGIFSSFLCAAENEAQVIHACSSRGKNPSMKNFNVTMLSVNTFLFLQM